MTEQEMKDWINNASYEELLRKWRFAPPGDPFFQPPIGDYYQKVSTRKKGETGDGGVSASKRVGLWHVQA